jgi:hypothetical protein
LSSSAAYAPDIRVSLVRPFLDYSRVGFSGAVPAR